MTYEVMSSDHHAWIHILYITCKKLWMLDVEMVDYMVTA